MSPLVQSSAVAPAARRPSRQLSLGSPLDTAGDAATTITIMKTTFILLSVCTLVLGCAIHHTSDLARLQGTWKGQGDAADSTVHSTFVITSTNLEFFGVRGEHYKGTFALQENAQPKRFVVLFTESPVDRYVGQTGNAIYKIEEGRLFLTGSAPGDPLFPASFDAPDARKLIFTR